MKRISLIALAAILAVGATALATDFITGYDVNNDYKEVQVQKGVYTPGISLTNDAVLGAGLPREVALVATTTSTTTTSSSAISLKGVKKATLFLTTNIPTPGQATTTFAVTVSGDGVNYTTFNKLIDNVTNTNAQNLTRVASKVYDSTSTAAIISLDLQNDVFSSFKVSVAQTKTASGTLSGASVKSLIEY